MISVGIDSVASARDYLALARGRAAYFLAVHVFRKRNGRLFVEDQSDLVLKLNIVFFTKL